MPMTSIYCTLLRPHYRLAKPGYMYKLHASNHASIYDVLEITGPVCPFCSAGPHGNGMRKLTFFDVHKLKGQQGKVEVAIKGGVANPPPSFKPLLSHVDENFLS
jgi:hypothetical protein